MSLELLENLQNQNRLRLDAYALTLVIVYVIVFFVGLISNFLVIYIILVFKRMQTMTNKFIMNLAVADLLVICICIPVTIGIVLKPKEWIYGEFLCRTTTFIQGVSVSVSVLTLTAISIDRYLIVNKPLKVRTIYTNTKVRITITFIWIISFAIMSPFVRVYEIVPFDFENLYKYNLCVEKWISFEHKIAYDVFLFITLFFLPIIFMSYAYTTITRVLWNVNTSSLYSEESLNLMKQTENKSTHTKIEWNQLKSTNLNIEKVRKSVSLHSVKHLGLSNVHINNNNHEFNNNNSTKEKKGFFTMRFRSFYKRKSSGGNNGNLCIGNNKTMHSNSIMSIELPQDRRMRTSDADTTLKLKFSGSNNKETPIYRLFKSRRRVVKLLIILVILFVVSWLPYYLTSLLIDYFHYQDIAISKKLLLKAALNESTLLDTYQNDKSGGETPLSQIFSDTIYPIVLCLALANSATNSVSYCLFNPNFRSMFKKKQSGMKNKRVTINSIIH